MIQQLTLGLVSHHQTIVVPGKYYPRLAIDLKVESSGWWGSAACMDDPGVVEPWRGPYGNREAAERNAACFGRDVLRAIGQNGLADRLTTFFQLKSHP